MYLLSGKSVKVRRRFSISPDRRDRRNRQDRYDSRGRVRITTMDGCGIMPAVARIRCPQTAGLLRSRHAGRLGRRPGRRSHHPLFRRRSGRGHHVSARRCRQCRVANAGLDRRCRRAFRRCERVVLQQVDGSINGASWSASEGLAATHRGARPCRGGKMDHTFRKWDAGQPMDHTFRRLDAGRAPLRFASRLTVSSFR